MLSFVSVPVHSAQVPQHTCGGEEITLRSWFSSTVGARDGTQVITQEVLLSTEPSPQPFYAFLCCGSEEHPGTNPESSSL